MSILKKNMRGYSLLEMIVSVGLFSLVMLVATGAYLTLIDLDRKARSTNEIVSNLSFAIDSMARSIRTGSLYGCGTSGGASGGSNGTPECSSPMFSFRDSYSGSKITYKLLANGTIGRCSGSPCSLDASFSSLTDPRIQIATTSPEGLVFYVRGVGTGDDVQPHVTFIIKGTMPTDAEGNTSSFVIQTSALQRVIDI